MDINYLLEREQIERIRADRAACRQARDVHGQLAASYRARIDDYRDAGGEHAMPVAPTLVRH